MKESPEGVSPLGWAGSAVLHVLILTLGLMGLPELWRAPSPMAEIVTVDVITVAEESVAPPESVEDEPEPQPEPEAEPEPQPEPAVEPEPAPPSSAETAPVVPDEVTLAEESVQEPVEPLQVSDTVAIPLPVTKPDAPSRPVADVPFTSVSESLLVDRSDPAPEEHLTTFDDVASALEGERAAPVADDEMASLQHSIANQVTRRWIIQSGAIDARNLIITIEVELSSDARVVRAEIVDVRGGESERTRQVAAESALRAVLFFRDHAFENLDSNRYDVWKELTIRFDPSHQF